MHTRKAHPPGKGSLLLLCGPASARNLNHEAVPTGNPCDALTPDRVCVYFAPLWAGCAVRTGDSRVVCPQVCAAADNLDRCVWDSSSSTCRARPSWGARSIPRAPGGRGAGVAGGAREPAGRRLQTESMQGAGAAGSRGRRGARAESYR